MTNLSPPVRGGEKKENRNIMGLIMMAYGQNYISAKLRNELKSEAAKQEARKRQRAAILSLAAARREKIS